RLTAETTFGAHLACNARHFAGKAVELVHHRVQRLLQLKDLAAHVHRDFAREVAAGDGGRHFGDVANLGRQIASHPVHAVRQALPRPGAARYLRLPTELAFCADLACDARHLRSKGIELIHHRVDGFLETKNFPADVDCDLFGDVTLRDGRRHFSDVA